MYIYQKLCSQLTALTEHLKSTVCVHSDILNWNGTLQTKDLVPMLEKLCLKILRYLSFLRHTYVIKFCVTIDSLFNFDLWANKYFMIPEFVLDDNLGKNWVRTQFKSFCVCVCVYTCIEVWNKQLENVQ